MLYNKHIIRSTARVLLLSMGLQLTCPLVSLALTSGPSQPEVKSFEPVGTTEMVDLFTGDFVYNIPLLDVEGYPVNISYHSGGDMEQEASWVGLGWNINPGVINRSVRGMPDDFNGEQIGKHVHIKPEKNVRVGLGVGAELAGVGSPYLNLSANLGINVNVSNYRGVSADFSLGAGVNVLGCVSAGINMGIGSQTGADVDYNAGVRFSTSMLMSSDFGAGVGLNYGHGYNTRSGVKDRNFSISTNVSIAGRSLQGPSWSTSVPCGYNNVIPVITNSSEMTMYRGQIKVGGELFSVYGHAAVYGMVSKLSYNSNGSMKGFGYLYAQNADEASILDFTRDKDGMFNETMSYLPAGSMTYDVYSVSGQGTGGSFRPFRNDYGSVYDPAVSSTGYEFSLDVEAGFGNLFELGGDGTISNTDITSGPWNDYKRPFSQKAIGSIYENAYFKQAGEATRVNPGLMSAIGGIHPITGTATGAIPLTKPGSALGRDARANLVYYFTGAEASQYGVASSTALYSYNSTDGFAQGADIDKQEIPRVGGARKAHHISEIVQVQTDGRRYIYGLPAMNTEQQEVTFATESAVDVNGLVSYSNSDISDDNENGRDHYFSNTSTPPFAHSYLLSAVLSADYVDVTGDGPTDDDFGSYTKFNYTRKEAAYQWKAPYGQMKAQFNEGYKSDKEDNKASYLSGSREQWILHSIETRNFVAEFYTSERDDAKDATQTASSYKLDQIRLFNKHDRFLNRSNAVPVKTVFFEYDYSLCPHVPNNIHDEGKLTLKKINVSYGNSQRSKLSPYQFSYNNNYSYSGLAKDRWGAYKPNNAGRPNADFPFVDQQDVKNDDYAAAWSLSGIILPSGGAISISYESDDYAYVQNKEAMEMCVLSGVGNSKDFSSGNRLYKDKDNPNTYFYFERKKDREMPHRSVRDNYLKGHDLVYYNFDVRLVNNAYESIKGYAEVEEVGNCTDGIHAYVKVKPQGVKGGGAQLNPATYTALNFARYYLPHIIFPGSDPDQMGISNVLAGIGYAFGELVSLNQSPLKRMVKEDKARDLNLNLSFMRLTSTGLKKKGGGQRVKQLAFSDNWQQLAGGNTQDATYGKVYSYTTEEQGSGAIISSGVASYEPQIGGDENPFRLPVHYEVQKASHWPPNDPVGLYQELPVGESLYPAPVVGYSRVTVKSIHQERGRSSQGVDIHDFYTAKDFPIQVSNTALTDVQNVQEYSFTEQKKLFKAAQGYTLVFNDMHGKPKRNEHRVLHPGTTTSELISYQQYSYHTDNGKLSNTVPTMVYEVSTGKLRKVDQDLGLEADITIDTREKKEYTHANTLYLNLNVFMVGVFPVPIPWGYGYDFDMRNEFRSVVATKVVQQYGILKEIQSSQEGAQTTLRNEAFDPQTGQALLTSVNNEFGDKEYSVNYPAYWGYKSMGPSYENTGYDDSFDTLVVEEHRAVAPIRDHFKVGDELLMTYTLNGVPYQRNAWIMGLGYTQSLVAAGAYKVAMIIQPRYKSDFPQSGTLRNVYTKVVRSGAKNQLQDMLQQYTGMSVPVDDNGYLKDELDQLISISAKTFSDTLTAILPQYDSALNPAQWDILNSYVNGTRQIQRVASEYVYMKNREYNSSATARHAGLFKAIPFWTSNMGFSASTFLGGYTGYLSPQQLSDPNWLTARTVTKYSPWGYELENRDAIGNYTAAMYGYNQQLPMALGQNARQYELFSDGFEDYQLLQPNPNLVALAIPPFRNLIPVSLVPNASAYRKYALGSGLTNMSITDQMAHTGSYMLVTSAAASLSFPVKANPQASGKPRYQPFTLQAGKTYIVSYWFRPKTITGLELNYTPPAGMQLKSGIIETWQQAEAVVTIPGGSSYQLNLPGNYYFDDLRIMPTAANMKAFVYHPVNQKLIATLDENNFASFYEYDQEGNLVRTKRETEKGIVTVSESRNANVKAQ